MSETTPIQAEQEEIQVKPCKTNSHGEVTDDDDSRSQSRHVKGILRSLWKPSYTLKTGSEKVRAKNRARLRRLLSRLVRRRNWEEASGVLSVLLKGTGKEKSPTTNRSKYRTSMELLKHMEGNTLNYSRIQHMYEIWMKRIGSMKSWPIKDRFVVQLEFILFSLEQGNVEYAHQAAICLMQQREFESDPISNMVVGLTFCGLWYSVIPKELLRDSDMSSSPMQSEMSGMRYDASVENSEGHDAVDIHEDGSSFRADSDTSVRIDKDAASHVNVDQHREISVEFVDDHQQKEPTRLNYQSQAFYMHSAEDSGRESSFSNPAENMQFMSTYTTCDLDSWLMPLRMSHSNENLEGFMYSNQKILNDYYKGAVKHLRVALYSTPPVYEALLPLVQMLLLGNHIGEAFNELEKYGHGSETLLPLRAKASLLEHIDGTNYAKLSACFEDILRKDPTCSHSLSKLITLHQIGEYSAQQLLETIALHLDTTHGETKIWKEFASCFLKLSLCEKDRMSTCLDTNEGENKHGSIHFNRIPEIFIEGISGKSWKLRCRWWLTHRFNQTILSSEIAAGELQLLAYKAASACHMYGHEFEYVVKARTCLEDNDRDLFFSLQMHMQNSLGFYSNFGK